MQYGFAGLTRLTELQIGGTHVTDAGFVHLGGIKDLRMLNLSGLRKSTPVNAQKGLVSKQRTWL